MYIAHHDISHINIPEVQVCYPSQQNMLSPNKSEVASGLGLAWPLVSKQRKKFAVIRADNMALV